MSVTTESKINHRNNTRMDSQLEKNLQSLCSQRSRIGSHIDFAAILQASMLSPTQLYFTYPSFDKTRSKVLQINGNPQGCHIVLTCPSYF